MNPVRRSVAAATSTARSLFTRAGNHENTLLTDPRINKQMREHFKKHRVWGKYGIARNGIPQPVDEHSPAFLVHAWCKFLESNLIPRLTSKYARKLPDISSIEQRTEHVRGPDGNDILLYIATTRAPSPSKPVPGILHMHGGGMMVMSANDPFYTSWRLHLALRGFVVISVEFRNSSGSRGPHPFPAALSDCMAGLDWAAEHRERLGIGKLLLSGESGGGNLSLATAIRAKQEGRIKDVDGVYALCPFIGGPSVWKAKSLPSLREFDGYLIGGNNLKLAAKLYDPRRKHVHDPRAWPLAAGLADLRGLPPHFISVDELDPLRDEGLAYAEHLREAGVDVRQRVVKGMPHAGELLCNKIPGCEHIFDETIDSLHAFAESL